MLNSEKWFDLSELPEINLDNRPLRDVSADAMKALERSNDPATLFVRSGQLVRLRLDENNRPLVDTVAQAQLRNKLARVADFVTTTKAGIKHADPPADVVADILSMDRWNFPALEGVVENPVMRPDGTIFDDSGYDTATKLCFVPTSDSRVPCIADNPSAEDVGFAVMDVLEAIADFPFADDASRINTLALLLTPIIRPAIDGPVPLALIDAPQAGTGKSLLADLVSIITTGSPAAMMAAPSSDDEWRKRISSVLSSGRSLIVIDNVEGALDAPSLAMALTCRTWTDRTLGRSEVMTIPQRAVWVATGNNIRLRGDLPRRCYRIRLDAKSAQPWMRGGFRHPNLIEWVLEQRGSLIGALLTIARAWFTAGEPAADTPMLGSFESWCRVVGGILAYTGLGDFLGNLEALHTQSDDDSTDWELFMIAWHRLVGDRKVTTAEIVTAIEKESGLAASLPDELALARKTSGDGFSKKLGRHLAKHDGYCCGDFRLERAGMDSHNKVSLWCVQNLRDMREVRGFSQADQPIEVSLEPRGTDTTFDDVMVAPSEETPQTPQTTQ